MSHKSIYGTAPEYIRQMFKFVMDVSQRNTSYVNNFKLYFKLYLPTEN